MASTVLDVNQFPYEIQLAIKGLNNENRQKILSVLRFNNKLSFSEIQEKTEIKRPLLASHLNKLIECLLVDHFYEHEIGEDKFSFYQLSEFGKRVMDSLDNALYIIKKETSEIMVMIKREIETTTIIADIISPDKEIYKSSDTVTKTELLPKQILK